MVAGPIVLGIVVDRFDFHVAEVAGACVVLVSIAAALVFVPRRTGPEPTHQMA
jgi:hypothetical protein